MPILTLPTSKKRPEIKTYSGRKLKTYISSETTEKLKSFSKTAEGSLFSTLISTWNILFYQYTQEHDFIVATPSAGRFHSDLENQIGFYANTLVLRNQLDPEADFITTYNTINDNTLAALNHQNYPFDELIENVGIKRDTSRNAIFDVMISLQSSNENPTATQQAKKEESIIDLGDCYSKFDIEVNFYEEDGQLALVIDYNKDVYENSMIHKMLQHYKMLVHELLQNPHQKIKNISLLSAEEKQLFFVKGALGRTTRLSKVVKTH